MAKEHFLKKIALLGVFPLKEPRDNLFKDCISGKRWGEHFKGILRDDSREINYPPNSSDVGLLPQNNNGRTVKSIVCTETQ